MRLFAAFMISLMYTSTFFNGFTNIQSVYFKGIASLYQLSSIAVPLFFMITGTLILKQAYSTKKQIHSIARLLCLYIVFGIVEYALDFNISVISYIFQPFHILRWILFIVACFLLYYYIISKKLLHIVLILITIYIASSIVEFIFFVDKTLLNAIFDKNSYRWYLIVLCGIYLIQPILCHIANDARISKLAIYVGLIYILVYNIGLLPRSGFLRIEYMTQGLAYRAIFYVLLGRYVGDYILRRDSFALKRSKLYSIVVLIFISIIQLISVQIRSLALGRFAAMYTDYFSFFVLANVVSLYIIMFRYLESSPLLHMVSSSSLYIYLLQIPIIKLFFAKVSINCDNGNIVRIILLSLVLFAISTVGALLIKWIIKRFRQYLSTEAK